MSIVTSNPVTTFLSSILDKLRLPAHLISDLFNFLFSNPNPKTLQKYLYLLGILRLLQYSFRFLNHLSKNCGWAIAHLKYRFNPEEFKKRYGDDCWVVITGFANGIGFSYAKEFAKLGFNLVLVDFNKGQAEKSEKSILQYNKEVKTRLVILDLTSERGVIQEKMGEATRDLDVGVLINNAGMGMYDSYMDSALPTLISCFKLNLLSVLEVTKVFQRRFLQRKPRSAIINLSSGISQLTSPYSGIYCPAKQFIRVFSQTFALQNHSKIDTLCVKPLGVITSMMRYVKEPTMIPAEDVTKQTIVELGQTSSTQGALSHKIFAAFLRTLTEEQRFDMYMKLRERF